MDRAGDRTGLQHAQKLGEACKLPYAPVKPEHVKYNETYDQIDRQKSAPRIQVPVRDV